MLGKCEKKIHFKKFINTAVSKRMGTINFIFVISARDTISHKKYQGNPNNNINIISTKSVSFLVSFHRIPAITIPLIPLGMNVSHCQTSFLSEGANLQLIGKYNKFISVLIKNSVMFPLMSGVFFLVLYLAFNSNSPPAQENLVKGCVKVAWTSLTYLSV